MKFRSALLLAAGVLIALLSCASNPNAYAGIDEGVRTGSYENALNQFGNKSVLRTAYSSKNEILLYLDRGMINHYARLYKDSSRDLERAELLIEEAFTRSLGQELGSYLLNDNVKNYSGEDYEDLYINVFNALNYYHENDLEGALVEIRRLNEKLNYLADRYQRATEKVLAAEQQIDFGQLPMEATTFSNSALARYLGVLFYRGTGRTDSARVDYEELLRAYELAPDVYTNPLPSSVEDELFVPEGKARLNVIAFTGLFPVKEQNDIVVPLPLPAPNNWVRFAIPRMVDRNQEIQRVEAVLDTGEKIKLELLEDMGAVASETFKYRLGLTVLKTATRSLIKTAASAAAAMLVTERSGESAGYLVGLLWKVFTEASERADTRVSRYFPCYAFVGGINLDPGSYTVTVNFYGNRGLVNSQHGIITVREKTINLKEFICIR